jgi:alpha-1,3-glucosyltransferase
MGCWRAPGSCDCKLLSDKLQVYKQPGTVQLLGRLKPCRYVEDTSEWTLDYPPFFAYFEWALAQVAAVIEPGMLTVQAEPYDSPVSKVFLRMSVIVGDSALLLAAFCVSRCSGVRGSAERAWVPFLMVVSNAALLMVDHVHFQYNGLLLSLLLFSLAAHMSERTLLGGFLFVVLLNFKHLYLVLAPVQFVYILRGWIWGVGWPRRLGMMGITVLAVCAASLAPVVATKQWWHLLARCCLTLLLSPFCCSILFPFRSSVAGSCCQHICLMR